MITLLILIATLRVHPLTEDSALTLRAHVRAEQLCSADQWSHAGWKESFAGLPYKHYGENLAKGFSSTADEFVAWKNSPTHFFNFTDPFYTKTGYATSTCGISVELFAGK